MNKAFSFHLCNCRESFLTPFCVGRCVRPRVSIEINDFSESVYSRRQHGTIQSLRSQPITNDLTRVWPEYKLAFPPTPFLSLAVLSLPCPIRLTLSIFASVKGLEERYCLVLHQTSVRYVAMPQVRGPVHAQNRATPAETVVLAAKHDSAYFQ